MSVNPNTGIKGFDICLSNINKAILAIDEHSMEGLLLSAALIREDMDKTSPLIPIDVGNLRSSWFATPFREAKQFWVKMGFTANYAIYVHEMIGPTKIGKKIDWSRPGSGPKFFEAAVKRNFKAIMDIIRKTVELPK